MMERSGVTAIAVLFMIVVAAAFGLAATMLMQSGQRTAGAVFGTTGDFYAAQSGLEWVRQTIAGYTTQDKSKWQNLNGTHMDIAGAGGLRFTLNVTYSDSNDNPGTKDSVTITSTGSYGDPATAATKRVLYLTLTVPEGAYLNDKFENPAINSKAVDFDEYYQVGTTTSPHSGITPLTTITNQPGGDTTDLFTHSSEIGYSDTIFRMGGQGEARFMIYSGACLKWRVSGYSGNTCDYDGCYSTTGCQAREGLKIPTDSDGYQNYFVKIRAKLNSGPGFGIYFRASYPNDSDPYTINFAGLTGYIWQYDVSKGYIEPCDSSTAMMGNDGMGMLFTRRIYEGSETCSSGCETFVMPDDGVYPFFCPENKTGLGMDGWQWGSGDDKNWRDKWRTIYIYVYHGTAKIYLGRAEIDEAGGETNPVSIGKVTLGSVGGELREGGIGMRVWDSGVVDVDYVKVYKNDDDYDPSTFPGGE